MFNMFLTIVGAVPIRKGDSRISFGQRARNASFRRLLRVIARIGFSLLFGVDGPSMGLSLK
jgi:hypothetical protein